MLNLDLDQVETPVYVCDLHALERNLAVLRDVQQRAECKILLALKGFAMWSTFPLVRQYLAGIAASGLHEARLGREEFDREVHVYSPAYTHEEFRELLRISDHVVFNSFGQWKQFREAAHGSSVRFGLRINPEHSEVAVKLYDPCAPGSRLGIARDAFDERELEGITGLHFHTLCELGADALERTLGAVEERFGPIYDRMQWANFGGGHHITRPGYDIELLVRLVREFKARHGVEVYLEPGEAIALNTGVLVTSVLDVIHHGIDIAILDTSATAHMPDVIEMPYRPQIEGAGQPGEFAYTYRLGGTTCLAGDVIGDYSFAQPLKVGDKLVFGDMAHYTMVKNTTFNGVRLPSIAVHDSRTGRFDVVRRFGYADYKTRLS